MRSLNAAVSPLLTDTIRQLVESEGLPPHKIVRAVAELSRLFTKERTALSRPYLEDVAHAAAYLQYFLPVNLAKIQVLLDEMPVEPSGRQFSVLDLGSGPGTGAVAVLDWWHRRKFPGTLSLIAVDNAPAALRRSSGCANCRDRRALRRPSRFRAPPRSSRAARAVATAMTGSH